MVHELSKAGARVVDLGRCADQLDETVASMQASGSEVSAIASGALGSLDWVADGGGASAVRRCQSL